MAVEVHARSGGTAFPPRDDVDARVALRIPRCAGRTNILDREPLRLQAPADELRAGLIGLPGRIDGGEANQVPRQLDHFFAACLDDLEQILSRIAGHDSLEEWRTRVSAARL